MCWHSAILKPCFFVETLCYQCFLSILITAWCMRSKEWFLSYRGLVGAKEPWVLAFLVADIEPHIVQQLSGALVHLCWQQCTWQLTRGMLCLTGSWWQGVSCLSSSRVPSSLSDVYEYYSTTFAWDMISLVQRAEVQCNDRQPESGTGRLKTVNRAGMYGKQGHIGLLTCSDVCYTTRLQVWLLMTSMCREGHSILSWTV